VIKTGAHDVARRRMKAYSFGTNRSQRSKPSAQQKLSLARRRLFYAQTITRFERQFRYPLWESEKGHLAQLLHLNVESPVRNEDAIRDASSLPQRAQGSAKVAQSDPRSEREVRDDLTSDAARVHEGDTTGHGREAAEEKDDSEVDDADDREIEEALQWLGAEWESITKILRQSDPGVYWENVY